MNLVSNVFRESYEQGIDDIHDTFAQKILVLTKIEKPKSSLSSNDDYDFVQPHKQQEEFDVSYQETEVLARIKYIEKQDKEFALPTTLSGEQLNLVIKFGMIRIKVKIEESELIESCSRITIDGNNCVILFRGNKHGLFDAKYATFFLTRTP